MVWTVLTGLAVLLLISFSAAQVPTQYENSIQVIRGKVVLEWGVDETRLCVRLSANVNDVLDQNGRGWFGFGLAEPTGGGMAGADIVVGHFDAGKGSLAC